MIPRTEAVLDECRNLPVKTPGRVALVQGKLIAHASQMERERVAAVQALVHLADDYEQTLRAHLGPKAEGLLSGAGNLLQARALIARARAEGYTCPSEESDVAPVEQLYEVLWPVAGRVPGSQLIAWARDDVANGECGFASTPDDVRDVEDAIAVLNDSGSVTLASQS